jgi:hypothetical protein
MGEGRSGGRYVIAVITDACRLKSNKTINIFRHSGLVHGRRAGSDC